MSSACASTESAYRRRQPEQTVLHGVLRVPSVWCGKTRRELALPYTYRVQVVAEHDVLLDTIAPLPVPDRKLVDWDMLLIAGAFPALERLLKLR